MSEDEPFLRAILADPDDRDTRLVYAGDYWVLDGRHLGHRGYREPAVGRLSVPHLDLLPPLSPEEAAGLDLLPNTPRS